MAFKEFYTLESGDVADGGNWSNEYKPDENVVIKRIYVVEKSGRRMYASYLTIQVENTAITHDKIPPSVLGTDRSNAVDLDIALKAQQKVRFSFENHEGVTVNFFLVLELHK
ncbi:MAG: hypothetical protein DRJ18_00700 [Candidatus Methanomethylicota archaeon]|nr:MAG: hypothetical protein DRJ18_00700 [Candidatus Verstraetearchaeota archaeon]